MARRAPFEPLLHGNSSRVSPCNAYRGLLDSETIDEYVARLAQELDDEFKRLGPDTVCAFIAEPTVGAVGYFSFSLCCFPLRLTVHSFLSLTFKRVVNKISH